MDIKFDKYSLIIDGKRILIKSAAFHYFRNPGEKAWRDRLSKIKACGYNTVDFYFNWGFHSDAPGKYDFTGIRDIKRLLEIAAELGLFVIARPGPYINAEISGGGFPFWLFNVEGAVLRNRQGFDFVYSKPYMDALKEWYSQIIPIINECPNIIALQVENEYSTNFEENDYINELVKIVRDLGVKVPLFHNDTFSAGLYANLTDIYAIDTYPTMNMSSDWRRNPFNFQSLDFIESNIRGYCPNSPLFIMELQSGWFDKWGGHGYEKVRKTLNESHLNIMTKTPLSQGVTIFSHYMGAGGTSWDNLGCDEVYSSYDFGALISEDGSLTENYFKAKEINYFLNSFNFAETENADKTGIIEEQENIFSVVRNDNINRCKWLFVRSLNHHDVNINVLNNYNFELKPFDMKILPIELDLTACQINFCSLSILGKVNNNEKETFAVILEDNQELSISDYDGFEIPSEFKYREENGLTIRIESTEELDGKRVRFFKNNQITEILFLSKETANRTKIEGDNIFEAPEFSFEKRSTINCPLENAKLYNYSPEKEYGRKLEGFKEITDGFDCISNRIYDRFIVYRAVFKEKISYVHLKLKHCYWAFLNGKAISKRDLLYSHEFSSRLHLPEELFFEDRDNELTIIVENFGFDKGFINTPAEPRGILEMTVHPHAEARWYIKGGLEVEKLLKTMTKEIIETQSTYFKIFQAEFSADTLENKAYYVAFEHPPFDRADIYLNGTLTGKYWRNKGPQNVFFLPEAFVKEQNLLSILIWDKDIDFELNEVSSSITVESNNTP